jgi:hypothetical protein
MAAYDAFQVNDSTDPTDETAKRKALLGQMGGDSFLAGDSYGSGGTTALAGSGNTATGGFTTPESKNTATGTGTTNNLGNATSTSTSPSTGRGDANWIDFTNQLAGNQGFDATAGRSGASDLATAARNGQLQTIIDQYNQKYGTNAKVVGNDKVDFGNGPQDVIRDSGNGTNAFWLASEGTPGGSSSPSGGGSPTMAYSASQGESFKNPGISGDPRPDFLGGGSTESSGGTSFNPSQVDAMGNPLSGEQAAQDKFYANQAQTNAAQIQKQTADGSGRLTLSGLNNRPTVDPTSTDPYAGLSPEDKAGRQAVLDELAQAEKPVDMNDPALAAQSKTFADTRTRQAQLQRSKMAERSAQSGLLNGGESSGAFDIGLNSIYSSAGQDISQNQSDIMTHEVDAKRQQLKDAITQANSIGAREDANKLQKQLAQLDMDYKNRALTQQNTQFGASQAQQGSQFGTNIDLANRQLSTDTDYKNRALAQAQTQFKANLDSENARHDAEMKNARYMTDAQIAAENQRHAQAISEQQSEWNDKYGLDVANSQSNRDRDATLAAMG